MAGAQKPGIVSTRQQRIAELAERYPERSFTSLAHNIDEEWLMEAYRRTRKDGAVGIDGQTAEEYGCGLEERLKLLLSRAKEGTYRAPAVRRVLIPKGDGKGTRPIGIPSFEDKILQRAVAMVLEPIYEREFLECSYGFRPGRSAHQALEALWRGLMSMGGGWVIEIDIKSFFDTIDRAKLREMINRRVCDGVICRLIDKWLKAGVLDGKQVEYPETGTPQGGVISPLLANIYLHEVLDTWFEGTVKEHLKGRGILVRYADDAVIVLSDELDARRIMEVLPKRFAKYGLKLHPLKTKCIEFRPQQEGERGDTFELLGFTHYWGRTRTGGWAVKRQPLLHCQRPLGSTNLRSKSELCMLH